MVSLADDDRGPTTDVGDADLAACLQRDLRPFVGAYEERKARSGRLDFLDLLLVTREGVRVAEVPVEAPRVPAPTWWAHLRACAWTAAWLTRRGQLELGARELATAEDWRGEPERAR